MKHLAGECIEGSPQLPFEPLSNVLAGAHTSVSYTFVYEEAKLTS